MQDTNKLIDQHFMNLARNIVNDEDNILLSKEDEHKKQVVIALCLKYKFRYKIFSGTIWISSLMDEWYFDFTESTISLFHRNTLQDVNGFHHQKDFRNIVHTLQYIRKHDKFLYNPHLNNKYNIIGKVLEKNK